MKKESVSKKEEDALIVYLRTKPDVNAFAEEVARHPELIPQLLNIIRTDRGSIKFYCDKVIRQVTINHPELVYPYFEEITALIDNPNNFIKWGAIVTIGKLALHDPEYRFVGHYHHYFSLIDDESMITAGNVIGQTGKFVLKYPENEPDITRRLLQVRNNTYWHKGQPSPECKHIVCGHVIECFDQYFQVAGRKDKILAFVEEQRLNPRKAVARKAGMFIKKYGYQVNPKK